MPAAIKIRDSDDQGFLNVGLSNLLNLLGSEGERLVWVVQDLTVSGRLSEGRSVEDLEIESRRPPHGIVMGWHALIRLAAELTQVQDGIFAGCRDLSSVPQIDEQVQLYSVSEVVLQATDSSYWQVYARNETKLKEFQRAFSDVETTFV